MSQIDRNRSPANVIWQFVIESSIYMIGFMTQIFESNPK